MGHVVYRTQSLPISPIPSRLVFHTWYITPTHVDVTPKTAAEMLSDPEFFTASFNVLIIPLHTEKLEAPMSRNPTFEAEKTQAFVESFKVN